MKIKLFIFLFLTSSLLYSQNQSGNFEWWNKKHNWDGHTPWQRYITLSPSYMGPNALPIPNIQEATIRSTPSFEYSNTVHNHPGDFTIDTKLKFIYPLFNRIQLETWIVPLEYFTITDTNIRDERAIRYQEPSGTAFGDLYAGAHIKVIDKKNGPEVVLGFAVKTASGSKLSMARYSDTPGYYFDISLGQTWKYPDKKLKKIRAYAMSGFYVYQTFDVQHNQNDAFLYGAGVNLGFERFVIKNQLGGYFGYMEIDDDPLVYRFEIKLLRQHFEWFLRYQYGIDDFPYHSTGVGVDYCF